MQSNYILVVEDNQKEELLILRAIQKCGVDVHVEIVRDGQEALDFFFGGETKIFPKLVLLDLKLPRVDGLQVLEALKKNSDTKIIPVVVFSSSDEQKDIYKSFELGANSYVRKPIKFEVLEDVIHQIDSYWLNTNQGPDGNKG